MQTQPLSTKQVLAELDRRKQARASRRAEDPLLPYLFAASVLHVFDPSSFNPWVRLLRPVDVLQAVSEFTVPAVGYLHLGYRSLKPEIRRQAISWLWQLGGAGVVSAVLHSNDDRIQTPVQQVFEQWMRQAPFDLPRFNYDELLSISQLYDWGLGELGGLPDRDVFDRTLRRRAAVSLFEHLVDRTFVGRAAELQVLRDYVGIAEPSIWDRLRRFMASELSPPLVIWGPGGVGKTALIGKFLLEHVDAPRAGWFPFAYLAFDSRALNIRDPSTLLVAATDQLEDQISADHKSGESARTAVSHFRDLLGEYDHARARLRRRTSARAGRTDDLHDANLGLYHAFGDMLTEIALAAGDQQEASEVPVLLVLDTFEEVYYRSREDLLGLWKMLEEIQQTFPLLRTVVSGRVKPRPFTVGGRRPIEQALDNLGPSDAQLLLASLGVADGEVAQAIYRQIGGSPLSLRLAARVAEREDATKGIQGLETRRFWIFSVGQEIIQGHLYRRILDHIHDPKVRALAHPGMVLRKVTVELIEEVLAPTCGLGSIGHEQAEALFEELRKEHALVSLEDDSSLRYREEVRRPVLALLANEKPDKVRALRLAAVGYHREQSSLGDRAEEIYNRMMLGEDGETLSRRWIPGIENLLASSIEEFPAEQQIWLASRMSIELPREVYAAADLSSWERLVGRKALELLQFADPQQALSFLRERRERSDDSPLFTIEARILVALGRYAEATDLIEKALDRYPAFANQGRFAELLWYRAQTAEKMNDRENKYAFLSRLSFVGQSLSSALAAVQALTEMLRSDYPQHSARSDSDRAMLAESLARLNESEVLNETALVRLAIVRLGSNFIETVARFAPRVVDEFIAIWRRGDVVTATIDATIDARSETVSLLGIQRVDFTNHQIDYVEAVIRAGAEMVRLGDGARNKGTNSDAGWSELILSIFACEKGSLDAAGLAGLDVYREPWEIAAVSEAS